MKKKLRRGKFALHRSYFFWSSLPRGTFYPIWLHKNGNSKLYSINLTCKFASLQQKGFWWWNTAMRKKKKILGSILLLYSIFLLKVTQLTFIRITRYLEYCTKRIRTIQIKVLTIASKDNKFDPLERPVVITIFTLSVRPSVRPSVPTFQHQAKHNRHRRSLRTAPVLYWSTRPNHSHGRWWSLFSLVLCSSVRPSPLFKILQSKTTFKPEYWSGRVDHWYHTCLV